MVDCVIVVVIVFGSSLNKDPSNVVGVAEVRLNIRLL